MAITDNLSPPGGDPGFLMDLPERAFVVALRNGFAQMAADPSYWDAILRSTDSVERASIRDAFAAGGKYAGFPIRVGYPQLDFDAPQVTVLVEAETAADGVLGYELAETVAGYFDDAGGEPRGSFRLQTLAIVSTAAHPDVALYLHRACDAILLASLEWFMRPSPDGAGLVMPEWQGSEPIIVDAHQPNRLWARQSKWSVTGIVGAPFRIADPARGILVNLDTVTVSGVKGRVTV